MRAAIVVTAAFAVAQALGDAQMTIFAVFGTIVLLVFTDFGGPWRTRLRAYLLLAGAGAVLVTLGTLCSNEPWLAASAMAVVGFAALFTGILNGAFAAASTGAIIAFVLPVMVPAAAAEIPERLAGWGLASGAAIAAAMLLWPRRPHSRVRASAADACRALADLVDASGSGDAEAFAQRRAATSAAVTATRRTFVGTPYRPTGSTGPTAALGHLVEDIAWVSSFVAAPAPPPPAGASASPAPLAAPAAPAPPAFPDERDAVRDAVAQVVRAAASVLTGGDERPDLARLERVRAGVAAAFMGRVTAWRAGRDEQLAHELAEAFQLRFLSYATWQLGSDALRAVGRPAPDPDEPIAERVHPARAGLRVALAGARQVAGAHASMRSVWLRNSVRGAVGLALAVLVGQLADVQHGFWVVLATLSVLRSQLFSTGATILQALAGTAAGIVVGGLLLALVGTDETVLWIAFPLATLLAAYAPRVFSFAAGQAAFSFLVLVFFNLIQPVGWEVGLVRAEDIVIGTAISLVVGLLLWPRGAAAVLRSSLAAAYDASATYLSETVRDVLDDRPASELDRVRRAAVAASQRLDDTFRQFLAERSSGRLGFEQLCTLVAGVTRVRRSAHTLRVGHALLPLAPILDGSPWLMGERALLERETAALGDWYAALGAAVGDDTAPPAPRGEDEGHDRRLRLVGPAGTAVGDDELLPSLAIAWAHEHVVHLRALEPHLVAAAGALARDR